MGDPENGDNDTRKGGSGGQQKPGQKPGSDPSNKPGQPTPGQSCPGQGGQGGQR